MVTAVGHKQHTRMPGGVRPWLSMSRISVYDVGFGGSDGPA